MLCSFLEALSISQPGVEEEITRENKVDVDKQTHVHLEIQNRSGLGALCDS